MLCLTIAVAVVPFSAFAQSPQTAAIQAVVEAAIKANRVKGIIVQVRAGGQDLYLQAAGESMTGVPVTTNMHFRNGAMAFTYMSTMLLDNAETREWWKFAGGGVFAVAYFAVLVAFALRH
jgi:pectin methylesterase-like acyl-CoA thioesterase